MMTQRLVKFRDSSPNEDEIEKLRLTALQSLNNKREDENEDEDELRRKALESINKKVIIHEQNQIPGRNRRNDSESTDCVDERDSDSDDDFVATVNKVASAVVCTGLTRTIRNQHINDNVHIEDQMSPKRRRKRSPSIHSSDFSFLSSEDEDTRFQIPDLRNKLEKRGIFRHRNLTDNTDNKIDLDNQTSDEDYENFSHRRSITANDVTIKNHCKSRNHRSKLPPRLHGNRATSPRKERTSVKDRLGWSKKSRINGGRKFDRSLDEKIKKISQKNRQIVERRKMINEEIEKHKMDFDSPVAIKTRMKPSTRVSR